MSKTLSEEIKKILPCKKCIDLSKEIDRLKKR